MMSPGRAWCYGYTFKERESDREKPKKTMMLYSDNLLLEMLESEKSKETPKLNPPLLKRDKNKTDKTVLFDYFCFPLQTRQAHTYTRRSLLLNQ